MLMELIIGLALAVALAFYIGYRFGKDDGRRANRPHKVNHYHHDCSHGQPERVEVDDEDEDEDEEDDAEAWKRGGSGGAN
jgi:hypothetical protein